MVFATRSEGGGCGKIPAQGVANLHSAICLILLWLSPVNRPPPVPNGRKRGGRERPPPKVGGHVTPDSGAEWHASIRPHAGRSRPHLSLREGSEQPPGGGADGRETDL